MNAEKKQESTNTKKDNMNHTWNLIHHHLGLGDHIICNGLVRTIIKRSRNVKLAVKEKNLKNVSRMFKDCDIKYFIADESEDTGNLGWCFGGDKNINFDESFYKQANVNFAERWQSFYIERNYQKETLVCDYLNLPSRFALIHNIASAGTVDINIDTDLPIIKMKKTPAEDTMFDWMSVIEKATEIHCINSSFIHLVDSMLPKAKLFYYDDRSHLPFSKKLNWDIIKV